MKKRYINRWEFLTQKSDYVLYTDYVDCGGDDVGAIMVPVAEERGPIWQEVDAKSRNEARWFFIQEHDLEITDKFWTRRHYLADCPHCGKEFETHDPFPGSGDESKLWLFVCEDCYFVWENTISELEGYVGE